MTQTDRVLQLLRQRREAGITAVDFAAPNIADGGKPIMRLAARIAELRGAGHKITDGGRTGAVKRYVLEEPQRAPEHATEGSTPTALFDAPVQPRSAYEDAA